MTRRERVAESWSHRPRLGLPMLVFGTVTGAFFMFMLDPREGRRRRALVRDRIAHLRRVMTRDVPARVEKRGRFFRGVARGIVHETTDVLPFNGHRLVDNETLVARVRSEVLRDERIKAGEIHLDAYEGCVTLRGQLEHPESIRRLVHDTAHIDGVREVRNFLHLPGTPPPNKAAVYSRWEFSGFRPYDDGRGNRFWFPSTAMLRYYLGVMPDGSPVQGHAMRIDVGEIEFNVDIPDAKFELEAPEGVPVRDLRDSRYSVIGVSY